MCVYVCLTKHDKRTVPRPKMFLFQQGYYSSKGHNHDSLSWVQVWVKLFSVSWKLMMLEHRQDHRCFGKVARAQTRPTLFWQGSSKNRGHKPKNLPWVQVPVKVLFCTLETSNSRRNENGVVLATRLQEQMPQPCKDCPGFKFWWRWFFFRLKSNCGRLLIEDKLTNGYKITAVIQKLYFSGMMISNIMLW